MSQTHRALAMLALSLALVAATTAVAAAATPPTAIEDQHDRVLRNQQAAQAERTQAAVQLARSMEHDFTLGPTTPVVAAQPAAQPDAAVPDAGVNVTATVLLGLVGGLVGGAAAIGGWVLATRRHRPRPAAAT
jgi:hypothetical protein